MNSTFEIVLSFFSDFYRNKMKIKNKKENEDEDEVITIDERDFILK